jgi:predicted enzyme related to lactoylglutathione lyase
MPHPTDRGRNSCTSRSRSTMKRSADTPAPVVTIGVTSIDGSMKKVEGGGGSTVQSRNEIPEMGAFAYFKDSEGNVIGLWESL